MVIFVRMVFSVCLVCLVFAEAKSQSPVVVYHEETINAGVNYTATPVPYSVLQSSGTTIFEAENEIILGPDCIAYPSCSGSDNEFSATGYFGVSTEQYFLAKIVPPSAYAELKKQLDGIYCEVVNKKLRFKYVEKYIEGTLNYQIYDYQRNAKVTKPITIPGLILTKKVGDNYLTIDLNLITSFTTGTVAASYYTLEVTNEKNEKTFLRFRYNPNE